LTLDWREKVNRDCDLNQSQSSIPQARSPDLWTRILRRLKQQPRNIGEREMVVPTENPIRGDAQVVVW